MRKMCSANIHQQNQRLDERLTRVWTSHFRRGFFAEKKSRKDVKIFRFHFFGVLRQIFLNVKGVMN
jgi:hypothetical protein